MSALAALATHNPHYDIPAALRRMLAAMPQRAPLGHALWHAPGVGLAQGQSNVTPDAPHDPATLTPRLVADVRLDAPPAASGSDVQQIAQAYARHGTDCAAHLAGDFAFVLYDAGRWLAAVDAMGARPLYVARVRGWGVAFASSIRALLAVPEVAAAQCLNEAHIAEWLTLHYTDASSTMYDGISALPPAHTMQLELQAGAEPLLRRYWHYDLDAELRLPSDAAYAERLRGTLTRAVLARARTAQPIAANLSGGLDSSSLVALLQDHAAHLPPIHTFSGRFTAAEADEGAFVDAVLARGHVTPHSLQPEQMNPLLDFDALQAEADEPFLYANYHIQLAAGALVRQLGARVWFDGLFGDSAVTHGEPRRVRQAARGDVLGLWRGMRQVQLRQGQPPQVRKLVWRYLKTHHPLLRAVREQSAGLRGSKPNPLAQYAYINPALAQRVNLADRLHSAQNPAHQPRDPGRAAHYRDLVRPLYARMVRGDVWFKWRFGAQSVYPYRDRDVLALCLALPAHLKLRDGYGRYAVRLALAGSLPEVLRWRVGKANMGRALLRGWLQHEAQRVPALLANPGRIAPYVDVAVLRTHYAQMQAGGAGASGLGLQVLQVAALDAWLRAHGAKTSLD